MYWDLFMVLPYSGYLKAAHISYAGGNGTIPGANRGIVRTDRRIAACWPTHSRNRTTLGPGGGCTCERFIMR